MYEFIDFFAEWCGPCHAMKPIIEEVEKEYAGKLKFSKLDVETNQDMAQKYGVMSIPTYLITKDGNEIDRKIGAMSKEALKKWLDSTVSK